MPDDQTQSSGPGLGRRERGLKAAESPAIPLLAHRLQPSLAILMAASMFIAATASAADWKFQAYRQRPRHATDNANLAPSGQEKGDAIIWVTQGSVRSAQGAGSR